MTAVQSPSPAASTDGKPGAAPPGAFVRLSAFDGLFLRSEHLNLMEDYSASLAGALGAASGPGVVHGFEVTLDWPLLTVSPGLAILADGRAVRATGALTLNIEDLSPPSGVFYRIGLRWGTWPFGEEPVQGLLCDSTCGCGGASTHLSRQAEGPFITVAEATDVTTFAAPNGALRSWIASELFRLEEVRARRWPATDNSLPSRWQPNPPDPLPDMLPLAILVPPAEGRDWLVDTWSARRDRGSAPPTRYWEWHLGARPREVFVAQVLQFQAQLVDAQHDWAWDDAGAALQQSLRWLTDAGWDRSVDQKAPDQDSAGGDNGQGAEEFDPAVIEFLSAKFAASGKGDSTTTTSFVEVPPAGFVGGTGQAKSIRSLVEATLGCPDVVRRVCQCSLGDVGRLLESAQHRDRTRTPVSADYDAGHDTHVLDLFVPTRDGNPAYDWVLFTRADSVECTQADPEPEREGVDVIHELEPDHDRSRLSFLGSLEYPRSTWAVPDDPKGVFRRVQEVIAEANGEATIRAQVTTEERRPLGYLRASLLAGAFDDNSSSPPPVHISVADGTETITISTALEPTPTPTPEVARALESPRRAAAKAATPKTTPTKAAAKKVPARKVPAKKTAAKKASNARGPK